MYQIKNLDSGRYLKKNGREWLDYQTARLYISDMIVLKRKCMVEIKFNVVDFDHVGKGVK